MKIRIFDEERNKMIYDLSEEGFGYIIIQSEKDFSIEVIKKGKNSKKLSVMESTNIFDAENELYDKDIIEYTVLGEKRIGVIYKAQSGEWRIMNAENPNFSIGLLAALNCNGKKLGNIYEDKHIIDEYEE